MVRPKQVAYVLFAFPMIAACGDSASHEGRRRGPRGDPSGASFHFIEAVPDQLSRASGESETYLRTIPQFASDDGSVVVGTSALFILENEVVVEQFEASFRWTTETGTSRLPDLPGVSSEGAFAQPPRVFAMNPNGSVLVGEASDANGNSRAFRWTESEGTADISPAGELSDAEASLLSDDGSVVAGYAVTTEGERPFRWTREGGAVSLGLLPGHVGAMPHFMSADGSVIAGVSFEAVGDAPSRRVLFRWSEAEGTTSIGTLPGYDSCETYFEPSVVAHGATMPGHCTNPTGETEAFLWSDEGGLVGLGVLPGATPEVHAVSRDESVVILGAQDAAGASHSFRWTASSGASELLGPDGTSITTRPGKRFMSEDGSVLIGDATEDGALSGFRWTAETGASLLGWLPTHTQSYPEGVSGDGITVAGVSMREPDPTAELVEYDGVVWPSTEAVAIKDRLRSAGVLPSEGFYIASAQPGRDSRLLFGYANVVQGFKGWVAWLPE